MKIYNTELDKYGWPEDDYDYICDKRITSGSKLGLIIEMNIWNSRGELIETIDIKGRGAFISKNNLGLSSFKA